MFHALAACMTYYRCKEHLDFDGKLRKLSTNLRELSVQILRAKGINLFMEEGETVNSEELLDLVSKHYNMTGERYCSQMMHSATWGGGPEIVALSNQLKR